MATVKSLTTLFRLLEITRAQVQQGYVLAEIPKAEISDLAQHHYLVTFIAWRLATLAKEAGAKINVAKVLELSLVHDLGELFGSDIAMPYAKANPKARTAAKNFERINHAYLAQFFGKGSTHFLKLTAESFEPTSDEGLIAKIADYVEVTHYKLYVHRLTPGDVVMARNKITKNITAMKDTAAKKALRTFLATWAREIKSGKYRELFEDSKEKK